MHHTLILADEDYATVKIPILLAKTIDRYLETDHAKRQALTSRADLVNNLLRRFFEDYESRHGPFSNRKAVKQVNGNDASQSP